MIISLLINILEYRNKAKINSIVIIWFFSFLKETGSTSSDIVCP